MASMIKFSMVDRASGMVGFPRKAAVAGADDPHHEPQTPQVPAPPRSNLDFPHPSTFGPGNRW